ncbi:MAG: hypothetical protein ABIY37_11170 [Devosia sp.]
MFGLFGKRQSAAVAQLNDFMGRLTQSIPEDLGLGVATVEHTANVNWMFGDFYDPAEALATHPEVVQHGVSEGQRLQASNLQVMAVGWIVWVHTFRAARDEELKPIARSMWALLIRGAPYAFDHSRTLVPLIGFELRLDDPFRVPKGFE